MTEEDVKTLSKSQKTVIDQIIDNGPCPAGQLPHEDVHSLYLQGLIYLDILIDDKDQVIVPPLEGFVMNRAELQRRIFEDFGGRPMILDP